MSIEEVASPMRVRIGAPADLQAVMALAMQSTEENAVVPPSEMRVLEHVWSALNQHFGIIGLIEGPDGNLEAGVMLRIGTLWYADEPIIEEKGVFVHPDFRQAKGGRGSRLLEWCEDFSDRMEIPLIIGVLSTERTKAKVRMYTRHLGDPAGAFWIYNGRTGLAPKADE